MPSEWYKASDANGLARTFASNFADRRSTVKSTTSKSMFFCAIIVGMAHREEPDLATVQRFFAERGLVAVRIPETPEKTPDFKIFRGSILVAFCEVKSPQDVFLDRLADALRRTQEEEIGAVIETGNVFRQYRCMERAANKASAQFNAANFLHLIPNILIFVNHDKTTRQADFEEAITGYFGGVPTCSALRDKIAEIDAYVWLNSERSEPKAFWKQN